MSTSQLTVTDIPVEVWLDNILTHLSLPDLLILGCVNQFFYLLTSDEPFWHRKLQQDFNFSGSDTARVHGWKFIYRRLKNPQLFVWGETSQGRLGLPNLPRAYNRTGLPFPSRLSIPGVQIVSVVACGMSFHALDSEGNMYVWGVLDGSTFAGLHSDGYAEGGKAATTPMRLNLPAPIRTISCGRLHASVLDASSNVWTFVSWGRPFRLASALLDNSSPDSAPAQVECGWAYTAILTHSGDVLVFWPYSGRTNTIVQEKFRNLDANDEDSKARPTAEEPNVIPCYAWNLDAVDPIRLPPIPQQLPELEDADLDEETKSRETRLIKIAGMDNFLIGLTNKGHVLRFDSLQDEEEFRAGQWEYLPHFSEAKLVARHEVFSPNAEDPLPAPQAMRITHISAHFKTFIAYSTGPQSVVLMGKFSTDNLPPPFSRSSLEPTVHRNLQYRSVIHVVLGDYHYGALTSDGKLFSWGAYSKGALGLGNPLELTPGEPGGFATARDRQASLDGGGWLRATPPNVTVPTEVKFHYGEKKQREKFCIAATAGGWQTGALVIDLERDDEEDDYEGPDRQPMPGTFPPDRPEDARANPGRLPLGVPGDYLFRVGFAGRGRGG